MNDKILINPIITDRSKAEIKADRFISYRLTKIELSEIRRRMKITQKQMSDMSGLSTQCISAIESDKGGNPTLKSIMKYLDTLGYELYFRPKSV